MQQEQPQTDNPFTENPFAPPSAPVADVAPQAAAGELASRGSRFVAAMVDTLIVLIPMGTYIAVNSFQQFVEFQRENFFVFPLAAILVWVVVNGYLIATRGQTVGKLLMRIKIVHTDGSRAGFWRILGLRYVLNSAFAYIPLVGPFYGLLDCVFIFGESRRCIHDHIAGTIVIVA